MMAHDIAAREDEEDEQEDAEDERKLQAAMLGLRAFACGEAMATPGLPSDAVPSSRPRSHGSADGHGGRQLGDLDGCGAAAALARPGSARTDLDARPIMAPRLLSRLSSSSSAAAGSATPTPPLRHSASMAAAHAWCQSSSPPTHAMARRAGSHTGLAQLAAAPPHPSSPAAAATTTLRHRQTADGSIPGGTSGRYYHLLLLAAGAVAPDAPGGAPEQQPPQPRRSGAPSRLSAAGGAWALHPGSGAGLASGWGGSADSEAAAAPQERATWSGFSRLQAPAPAPASEPSGSSLSSRASAALLWPQQPTHAASGSRRGSLGGGGGEGSEPRAHAQPLAPHPGAGWLAAGVVPSPPRVPAVRVASPFTLQSVLSQPLPLAASHDSSSPGVKGAAAAALTGSRSYVSLGPHLGQQVGVLSGGSAGPPSTTTTPLLTSGSASPAQAQAGSGSPLHAYRILAQRGAPRSAPGFQRLHSLQARHSGGDAGGPSSDSGGHGGSAAAGLLRCASSSGACAPVPPLPPPYLSPAELSVGSASQATPPMVAGVSAEHALPQRQGPAANSGDRPNQHGDVGQGATAATAAPVAAAEPKRSRSSSQRRRRQREAAEHASQFLPGTPGVRLPTHPSRRRHHSAPRRSKSGGRRRRSTSRRRSSSSGGEQSRHGDVRAAAQNGARVGASRCGDVVTGGVAEERRGRSPERRSSSSRGARGRAAGGGAVAPGVVQLAPGLVALAQAASVDAGRAAMGARGATGPGRGAAASEVSKQQLV